MASRNTPDLQDALRGLAHPDPRQLNTRNKIEQAAFARTLFFLGQTGANVKEFIDMFRPQMRDRLPAGVL